MALFIFYTFEGYTISPNETEVENLQILGIESGINRNDALEKLIKGNQWIEESGFSKDKIKYFTILSSSFQNDVKTIVDYMWNDEERQFKEY